MPMDGLTIGAVVYELNNCLVGARVDKINQPEDDEVHFLVRNNGKNYKLLLCSNASFARLNITEITKPNPITPTNFCMLLRKHLTNARISSFKQFKNERIIIIYFDCLNDFNETVTKKIILEIMGKHSNIILLNENNKIFDSIKRVNSLMSRVRLVQPGIEYTLPPDQGKSDPFEGSSESTALTARIISDKYMGISRQAAEEITHRCQTNPNAFENYIKLYENHTFSPVLLVDENDEPIDFYAVEQKRFMPDFQKKCSTISEAIDRYFFLKDRIQRIKERSHGIKLKINNLLEKAKKKKAQYYEKFLECSDMEKYRIWGELLTANIYLVKKGAKEVTVQNYYDNMSPLSIPLDNTFSPSANAQKYFKYYNKLKTASKLLTGQMNDNEKEISFLTELLEDIEKCENEDDLSDIKKALVNAGYLKQPNIKEKKSAVSKPMHFISSENIDIYVGKNNVQNDYLTLHFADSDDLWLHTKDIHGSHVIVKSTSPDNKTIEEAAQLAAFFSKAKNSSSVPVDATKRRFVKKPSGALPGKVIYTNQVTYYITPDEKIIRSLRKI